MFFYPQGDYEKANALRLFEKYVYVQRGINMSIASINIQSAKSTSKAHMSRDKNHKITYLLDPDSNGNEYKSFLDSEKYLAAAMVAAKKLTGRKMQQKAIDNFVQEAVLNLENFHSVENVEKVFLELKKEFGGFQVFDIAIHRDEGYFYNFKEELEYRPNRDIFFNDQDKNFYLDSKLKNKADLNQFEKRYNFHAHVLFSKFDMTTGKNPRLKKSDMSKIQTISANALGMQRGELFSKAKRMSHWQLKKGLDLKRDEKQKEQKKSLAKQKDLKAEIGKLRAELKELGAVRADYAELEQVNKELKEKIKQKDLTEQELTKKINHWRHEAINWREGKNYKDLYEELSQENKNLKNELEAKISPNEGQSTPKGDKNALKAVFEEINHQNEEGKPFETHKLEQDAKQTENHASAKIFKKVYETRGTESQRTEKINWLESKVIPTVSFDIQDLEKLYSELQDHDEKRTLHFQKAMTLFRRAEKSLQRVFNFVKDKFIPKQELSKNKSVQENEENPRRGFRR